MKRRVMLWALLLFAVAIPIAIVSNTRSARPVPPRQPDPLGQFDAAQSVGLFMGGRNFGTGITDVPYAPDDAVDLAYAFTENGLVHAERTVIALAGVPTKASSKNYLAVLEAAGAQVIDATKDRVEKALRKQMQLVGPDGILVLSFATHGFSTDGVPYLLAKDSVFRRPETALSATKIIDDATATRARRSITFIDACRERVTTDTRADLRDRESAATLIRRMSKAEGHVVFYAAANGQYAFDDHQKQNGVFTAAVLDGLRCRAPLTSGCVTVDGLERYVEKTVRAWIRKHKKEKVKNVIQVVRDGSTRSMPLVACDRPIERPKPIVRPERVEGDGRVLKAFSKKNALLWTRHLREPITHAVAADLNSDGRKEAIASTDNGIFVFHPDSSDAWNSAAPVRAFHAEKLFYKNKTRQVVTLSSTHISLFDFIGKRIAQFAAPDTHTLLIAGVTSKHLPRIIAATSKTVFLLDPKTGEREWEVELQSRTEQIVTIALTDHDGDKKNDIEVQTTKGVCYLDFEGATFESKGAAPFTHRAK
jgi:hypothetical protein